METTGTNIMKKLTGDTASGAAVGIAMGKNLAQNVQKTNEERRELAQAYEKESPSYTIESSDLFKRNTDEGLAKALKDNPAYAARLKAEERKWQEQLGKQLQKEGWEATKAEVKSKPEQAKTVSYAEFIKNKGGSK